jgi:crotonobetainyl-CoA:carnitine CoA-transferase CaiB-like acyl-CoA transferase
VTIAPPTDGPLAGVRVLDLSRVLAGPYCSMILADMGADIVKVENPQGGDITRAWGPPWAGDEATYYMSANRGKRSIAIDLRDPAGVEVARRIAATCDVVIENFIPGGAERMGLGWETLRADNPALVYCSISGYPHDSPEAPLPGFDFAIQGEGGIMSITGEVDGAPMKVGVAIADLTSGMFAANGILAALVAVRGGGPGRRVQVSLFDSQLAWLANRGTEASIAGWEPARFGNAHPSIVPYETFPTTGAHIIVAVGTDLQFRSFCEAIGLPEVGSDTRFATNPDRVANRVALIPLLQEATATFAPAALLAALAERDVPSGPVRTIPEALAAAPYALQSHTHPTAGEIHTVRSPIAFDGDHLTSPRHPPLLGEHTRALLLEAGFSEAETQTALDGPCHQR